MEGGNDYKKGLWTAEEDTMLMDYVRVHGKGKWSRIAKMSGLKRCGKSCRLRWMNYLSPSVKRGDFSEEEEDLIIRLHKLLGNRWSLIAGRVPGRTDNQVKNHWNTHLSKKLGIKKGKTKDRVSSKSLFNGSEKIYNTPFESTFEPPFNYNSEVADKTMDEAAGGTVIEDGSQSIIAGDSQSVLRLSNTQNLTVDENYEYSFWFSHDELNLHSPFMEPLYGHYLDFVWDGTSDEFGT